jgi:hypothetical protein
VKGYWPAAWPGEDAGPRRLQATDGALGASNGRLVATSRGAVGATMVIQRDPGELYVQGAEIGPGSTAWIERVDPLTLDPIARVSDLPAGPWWPGGALVHANGDLYMTQGRWCHRLSPDLEVRAAIELPRDRPYNSLLALPDGWLVMKDMSSDDDAPSQLVVLDADDLTIVGTRELDEGSIARISADDDLVAVVGMQSLISLQVTRRGVEEVGRAPYRRIDGQTFGWDAVIGPAGSAWFLDNGAGTEQFGGSFVGRTRSSAPLHLVRATWPASAENAELYEICGEPGGIVANPPIVADRDDRTLAVGYDSGHGRMTAWELRDGRMSTVWRREQNHAAHSVLFRDSGELVTFDFDQARGIDQCVVLDIDTGRELGRVDTDSPIQSVLFPCPGWDHDVYTSTFSTLTRVQVSS